MIEGAESQISIANIAGIEKLWQKTTGSPDVCVAVLDGPVDLTHPCFHGAQLAALSLFDSEATSQAALDHGTFVASLIFGQKGSVVEGIAPGCRGVLISIYQQDAEGNSAICSQLDLARAISLAVDHGAQIINISGGHFSDSGASETILSDTIRRCKEAGVLIIAAAGNDGCSCVHVPACEDGILAVGAMDADGDPLDSSNWGDSYQSRGIIAPGKNILGASVAGQTTLKSGTSFATAITSGVAALLLSLSRTGESPLAPLRIGDLLKQTASPCDASRDLDCKRILAGRLNVEKATNALIQSVPSSHLLTNAILMSELLESTISMSASNPVLSDSSELESLDTEQNAVDVPAGGIQPSDCGCGGNGKAGGCSCKSKSGSGASAPPHLVYALGKIGFDFGLEARRDSFVQMAGPGVNTPEGLAAFLESNPSLAESVIWTLNIDTTVIYAIRPQGSYAAMTYARLVEFLRSQSTEGVERVSVPGVTGGSVKLLNGQPIPVLIPELRGMYSWSTAQLVHSVVGQRPKADNAALDFDAKALGIQNFLRRVYYEIRNLGITSQERATNYAATNAFQLQAVYTDALKNNLALDTIAVERSPLCRPGSECWDVKLTFFNPSKRFEQARRVYRYTIDVSDIVPVAIGDVRQWEVY